MKPKIKLLLILPLLFSCGSENSSLTSPISSEETTTATEQTSLTTKEETTTVEETTIDSVEDTTVDSAEDTSDSTSSYQDDIFDENDVVYENFIEKPSLEVHDFHDLMAVCDYHAFYKIPEFVVDVSDYTYGNPTAEDVYYERNFLYWNSELINGVMGVTMSELEGEDKWLIEYTFYENATVATDPTLSSYQNFGHTKLSDRDENFDDFKGEDESLPLADVYTTQQLFYALEHHYRVTPLENSPAEKYYALCKDLLRDIVSDDMSDQEKFFTIYNYIINNVHYDYEALDAPESEDLDFPDKYCASYKAFYIEGFFDDQTVVCDGFSKTYVVLARLEGLDILRATGAYVAGYDYSSINQAGHAYCFINYDGTYHLSCPTWGQQRNGTYSLPTYDYFAATHKMIYPYLNTYWDEIELSQNSDLTFLNHMYFDVDETEISAFDLKKENFNSLLSLVNNTPYSTLSFHTKENPNELLGSNSYSGKITGTKVNFQNQTFDGEYLITLFRNS